MDDLDDEFERAMASLKAAGLPEDTPAGEYSHDALALAWGAEVANTTRYVDALGRWLHWDGLRWLHDQTRLAWTMVREFIRPRALGQSEKLATKLRSAQTIGAVVNLARSNREIAATVEQWDRDPYLLGTPAGTVDLRTGLLHDPDPTDFITQQTAAAPAPAGTEAPGWSAFLARIFRHDPELVPYMQRVAGYSATGLISEHVLVFGWGEGGNGKSVFFNIVAYVLGDYAKVAASDLLLETQSDRHPTDMAMLMGARLVIASEVSRGRSWNEPKLKSLTGGDPITARYMRQDFFTYLPQFTLLVAGNHKPSFRSVDEAVRRRVQLVPFLQNIPRKERDPNLPEKLKAEAPAILRWIVDGCLEWQRQGLNPPASVREASESYLEGEDVLGGWLNERCILGGTQFTPFDKLYSDWKTWCEANGGPRWSGKTFSKALDERGILRAKSGRVRGFRGIKLRP